VCEHKVLFSYILVSVVGILSYLYVSFAYTRVRAHVCVHTCARTCACKPTRTHACARIRKCAHETACDWVENTSSVHYFFRTFRMAVYAIKRALYSIKRDLFLSKRPHILSREPWILPKEPYILSAEYNLMRLGQKRNSLLYLFFGQLCLFHLLQHLLLRLRSFGLTKSHQNQPKIQCTI